MFSKLIIGASLSLLILTSSGGAVFAAGKPHTTATNTIGVDISFPNCSATIPAVDFGIVGVNGGLNYSTNTCITQEASNFKLLSLYANTGWNDQSTHIDATSPNACVAGDANCLAYNYGYNAGMYAYNVANQAGVTSSNWWLDVETGNTWNADTTQNRNSLQGEYDYLTAQGLNVGVYSTTYQWGVITGGWLNGWSNWGATTLATDSQAKAYCTGHNFTNGATLYVQYQPKGARLDYDVKC